MAAGCTSAITAIATFTLSKDLWNSSASSIIVPDPHCPGHAKTHSPEIEVAIAPPHWAIGWDVFCWIGHRRFSRHWAIPQIQAELRDTYRIAFSDDAISQYTHRYQAILAARQQDPEALRRQYESVPELILTIDGLQPEKGHETLYVVRELTQKRVWFAEALISATADEVRRLIATAKEWAEALGKDVVLWISDKQDAFVTGIAGEFPGVPHRYCDNHFLRDVAKPVLEADSHAKVQMRSKVRGLRTIEQAVLKHQRAAVEDSPAATEAEATVTVPAEPAARRHRRPIRRDAVVRDYCSAVRGILNDDQGGPLHPPGLRMAAALDEVRDSIQRNLDEKKGGSRRSNWAAWPTASTGVWRGPSRTRDDPRACRGDSGDRRDPRSRSGDGGPSEKFEELIDRFERREEAIHQNMAKVMISFLAGLFVGRRRSRGSKTISIWSGGSAGPRVTSGESMVTATRGFGSFKKGRRWCTRWMPTCDASRPFTADDLLPYRTAREPPSQREAMDRRKIMRKARSAKKRPVLLADLERRYRESPVL